jgi:uncharacterized C2H2 Zn-finger protein
MSFTCEKCGKTFNRELHYIQHTNRKISCNRVLKCERCFKCFSQLSNYKQHMNRIIKCYDERAELSLMLKIEKEKTKQAKLSKSVNITNNITNTINITTFNIYHPTWSEAYDMIQSGDGTQTVLNMLKYQYKNPEFPENQCMIMFNGKPYLKAKEGLIDYSTSREFINDNIKKQSDGILDRYTPFSDEYMDQHGRTEREALPDEKIKTVENTYQYVTNNRNSGIVKKQLIIAID